MHDSSDRHVPTVLDDAIEALTHSGSQALQIEAPVNAYIANREVGNRSPFGGVSSGMNQGGKAQGSRSPSPMRWKDLGRTGVESTGRAGSRSTSPLPSPTREKRSFISRPEVGDSQVFSLNDDSNTGDDKSFGTRPSMQARQSSLGVLIPGAFPGASSQQEQAGGGKKWRKKIDEWIGPRPNALLADSSEKQGQEKQGKSVDICTERETRGVGRDKADPNPVSGLSWDLALDNILTWIRLYSCPPPLTRPRIPTRIRMNLDASLFTPTMTCCNPDR